MVCLNAQTSSFGSFMISSAWTRHLTKVKVQDIYLDNILLYIKTKKEHLQMIEKAFKHLLKARLKLNLVNSHF